MKNFLTDLENLKAALLKTGLNVQHGEIQLPKIPKILIIGNEKSGKSSFLEKLIDTKIYIENQEIERPIVLRTKYVDGLDSWFEFEEIPGSKFITGEELGNELIKAASTLCEENPQQMMQQPVIITYNSSRICGNMNFVDFPGVKSSINWSSYREAIIKRCESDDQVIIGVMAMDEQNQGRIIKLLNELDPSKTKSGVIFTKLDTVKWETIQSTLSTFISTFPLAVGIGNVPDSMNAKEILCVDKDGNQVQGAIPRFASYEGHLGIRAARDALSNLLIKYVKNQVFLIRDKLQKRVFDLNKHCSNVATLSTLNVQLRNDVSVSSLLKTFGDDLNTALAGRSSGDNKDETIDLTEGARINLIFEKTLPARLRNINSSFDETDNKEVVYAIKNSRAVRTGFFIPDKAFNTVARQRIEKFRQPFLQCLKDIMALMEGAINRCGQKSLLKYPLLFDEVTRKCIDLLFKNEMVVQDYLDSTLKMEECYINSANEDFLKKVEAANALAENGHAFRVRRSLMSTNLNKSGILSIINQESNTKHKYWFVLTSEKLEWSKQKDKKTVIGSISIENLRIMDGEEDGSFCMFFLTGKRVSHEHERLSLKAENEDDAERWKTSFLRAGVFPVDDSFQDLSNDIFLNGQLNESVALIRHLTLEYMKIIKKNLKDKFTKMIVYYLIKKTMDFIRNDLVLHLYSLKKDDELLRTSSDAESSQQRNMDNLAATNEAIQLADNLCFAPVYSFLLHNNETAKDIISRAFGDELLNLKT